jgi:hypothetical protein
MASVDSSSALAPFNVLDFKLLCVVGVLSARLGVKPNSLIKLHYARHKMQISPYREYADKLVSTKNVKSTSNQTHLTRGIRSTIRSRFSNKSPSFLELRWE